MRATPELLASLHVRRARRDDVAAIVALYAGDVLGAHREDPATGALGPYLAAFDAIYAEPGSTLYVAELEGGVVGTFQLTLLRHLTHHGARVAQLEAVHVAAASRGHGIGEAMVDFAVEEARRAGCHRMQLTSNKRRADAHRFYARLGFVASHEGMKLVLG